MAENYKIKITNQINEIVGNIFINDKDICDKTASPIQIKDSIGQYKVSIINKLSTKAFNEILLTNWIYARYYHNREKAPLSSKLNQRHFPFKNLSQKGTDAYWRNRFWRYGNSPRGEEKVVLIKGHETRIVENEQFVEDEYIFEPSNNTTQPSDLEIIYLSMIFPKFEINNQEKFLFGLYPFDDDGQGGVIRFYFHLDINNLTIAIPRILVQIRDLFNERLIPFQIKFRSDSGDFARADHFVLYIERRHFYISSLLIKHIYPQIAPFLNQNQLPLFVLEAMPGIGFAKSPSKELLSFGASRSRTIAKAILKKLEDDTKEPVLSYLDKTWGGIENFYLDPHPSFIYNFDILEAYKIAIFQDVKESEELSAAWYLARLLCREAIWVGESQCNWMNYCQIEENSFGYQLLATDTGFEGLESVILFLESFAYVGIQDPVLEHVLASAKRFFKENHGTNKIGRKDESLELFSSFLPKPKNIFVSPQVFKSGELKDEIDDIIKNQETPILSPCSILTRIINEHLQFERPIGNRLDGTDNFCANINFGIAGYGYAYLRLYDSKRVTRLCELKESLL